MPTNRNRPQGVRTMAVKMLGLDSIWVLVESVDLRGQVVELDWLSASRLAQVRSIQLKWKVPAARVVIDGSQFFETVVAKAAECFEWAKGTVPGVVKYRRCWRVLLEDGALAYPHGKEMKPYSTGQPHQVLLSKAGRVVPVVVYAYQWSRRALRDHLIARRTADGGRPKAYMDCLKMIEVSKMIQGKHTELHD